MMASNDKNSTQDRQPRLVTLEEARIKCQKIEQDFEKTLQTWKGLTGHEVNEMVETLTKNLINYAAFHIPVDDAEEYEKIRQSNQS
jgi:hypothetical protein